MSTLAANPDADLRSAYSAVRALTDRLARPLSPEDQTAQSMPDVSDDAFRYLFNSDYEAVGPRHPRAARGLVTPPGDAEIGLHRTHVDAAIDDLVVRGGGSAEQDLVTLGLLYSPTAPAAGAAAARWAFSGLRLVRG